MATRPYDPCAHKTISPNSLPYYNTLSPLSSAHSISLTQNQHTRLLAHEWMLLKCIPPPASCSSAPLLFPQKLGPISPGTQRNPWSRVPNACVSVILFLPFSFVLTLLHPMLNPTHPKQQLVVVVVRKGRISVVWGSRWLEKDPLLLLLLRAPFPMLPML